MILGIDQGLANCGYAIVLSDNDKYKVEKAGYVKTTADLDTGTRLLVIFNELSRLVDNFKIDMIVTENLHVGGGSNKAIVTVNMVTGMIHLLGALNNIPVIEVVPTSVKKQITGDGKASKDKLYDTIKDTIILSDEIKLNNHITDAIALGIFGNKKCSKVPE